MGIVSTTEDDYPLSFQVEELDIFLSHSWHAPWWMKYLTLLFYFNAVPTVVAVVVAAILNVLAKWLTSCSFSMCWPKFSLILYSSVFLLTLFTWHHVSAAAEFACETIFLDKVCIHQTDPALKARGIKSIGGLLSKSKRMLVAWDPSYFTRLWCTFELAAFKHAQPQAEIALLPIVLGRITTMLAITSWAWEGFRAFALLKQAFFREIIYFAVTYICAEEFCRFLDEVRGLKSELKQFSVRKAKCYCCSVNHRLPGTEQVLPCDREEVNGSIAHWYGGDNMQIGLNKFDEMIHGRFKNEISAAINGSRIPYTFVLLATVWPGVYQIEKILKGDSPEDAQPFTRCMLCVQTMLLAFPMNIGLLICAISWCSKQCRLSFWTKRILMLFLSLANVMCHVLFIHISRGPLKKAFGYKLGLGGFLLGLVFMSMEALVTRKLYRSHNLHEDVVYPEPETEEQDAGASSIQMVAR